MKFTDKKYEATYHIFANGKGEDTCIAIRSPSLYEEGISINLSLIQAKQFKDYFLKAIEDAEKRSILSSEEED